MKARIIFLLSILPISLSWVLERSSFRGPQPLWASSSSSSSTSTTSSSLQSSIDQLKQVLEREYTSFFAPMEREWYLPDVSFDDPLTSLAGVDAYQANVDMLGGRNFVGKLLFDDAAIVLHSITGGEIVNDTIRPLITRWTLRFTFSALPWQPTARFTGISEYQLVAVEGQARIARQDDYWDSINLRPGGRYEKVAKKAALGDLVDQLRPQPQPSAGELPYQLLRRAADYEVRHYPAWSGLAAAYERRDEAYLQLGEASQGMNPLAPSIVEVGDTGKRMLWPVHFAAPGQTVEPVAADGVDSLQRPALIQAVARFADAATEPVVRRIQHRLKSSLARDGLPFDETSALTFAQYDAVYSLGQRRGEVWIPLRPNHPWDE